MKNRNLSTINKKTDYLTALEAVSGRKTEFTESEKNRLLDIYLDNAKNKFSFDDTTLVQAVLALDVPGANLLDKAGADALSALADLCEDWEPNPQKASTVKEIALSGDVPAPLSLALARAALDAYAGQSDIGPYREEITALAGLLRDADEDAFDDASVFLIRVREHVRTK